MVHGGMTLIKYLLFLFNFIFWLSGIGILVAGAVIQIKFATSLNLLGDSFFAAPIILMVVGYIIALLGFFGCCGAIRENYCMTITFAVLLGIIFILELAAGIAGYVLRNQVENVFRDYALQGMYHYNVTNSEGVTKAWDNLQANHKCCGVSNYTNWENSTAFENTHDVPESCCMHTANLTLCEGVLNDPEDVAKTKIYITPCLTRVKQLFSDHIQMIAGVTCGIAIIQILGISFACCLSKSIMKEYEDYYY